MLTCWSAADGEHDPDSDHDAPVFSAFSGKFVDRGTKLAAGAAATAAGTDASGTALVTRNQETALSNFSSPALDFLNSREYRGLDPAIGDTPVGKAVPGWFGTAMSYVAADAGGSEGDGGSSSESDGSDADEAAVEPEGGAAAVAAGAGSGAGAGAGAGAVASSASAASPAGDQSADA